MVTNSNTANRYILQLVTAEVSVGLVFQFQVQNKGCLLQLACGEQHKPPSPHPPPPPTPTALTYHITPHRFWGRGTQVRRGRREGTRVILPAGRPTRRRHERGRRGEEV